MSKPKANFSRAVSSSEQILNVIGPNPPNDGNEWDCQCARCGSSMFFEECPNCGGEGLSSHDCGEDCCVCEFPENNVKCDWCDGLGGHWDCVSGRKWCENNPMEDRENIESGTPEWFIIRQLSREGAQHEP